MNKKVKILFLVHSFNIGGITTNTLNMIKYIDFNKFDVHIVYIKDGILKSEFEKFNVKFYKIGEIYKFKSFVNLLYINKVSRYIYKNKIEVVHTQDAVLYMIGSISSKICKCKHIRTQPNLISVYEKLNTKTLKLLPFEKWTHKYIALNEASAKDLIRVGVAENKVETIQGYFDNKDACKSVFDIRSEYSISRDKKIICSIGRLVEGKGFDLFIDIAKVMIDQDKNLIFLVIGDGKLKESLIRKVDKLNLNQYIIFTGYRTDIFNIIRQIDVGVFPVKTHAGMVEVVAAGKVLVSGKSDIMSEYIVNGFNGVLVDTDDPNIYANEVLNILYDVNRMKKMNESSKVIYENRMSGYNNILKFENIINEIIT